MARIVIAVISYLPLVAAASDTRIGARIPAVAKWGESTGLVNASNINHFCTVTANFTRAAEAYALFFGG
jgi:hypothetical protein